MTLTCTRQRVCETPGALPPVGGIVSPHRRTLDMFHMLLPAAGDSSDARLSAEDLDALERAAAEVSSSSSKEEEGHDPEGGAHPRRANGTASVDDADDSSGLEARPVGVGVLAPPDGIDGAVLGSTSMPVGPVGNIVAVHISPNQP